MKRIVLHLFFLSMLSLNVLSQTQTLTLKIIQTGLDGSTAISFDDGEFENDSIDKLNDDDLDMGWDGEDGNIMTSFLRFQNVTIPKGAYIISAKLKIYAHEDESAEAKITIFAENADNSAAFTANEALNTRTWTTDSLKWNITENWTMWQAYSSPNFSNIVQKVIDRAGWTSGNALTIFVRGENQGASILDNARDFESFENIEDPSDGGDGLHHAERIPVLEILYEIPGDVNLRIVKTGTDGATDISFDDGEYENDSIDKLNDDDLDMGWEGEDGNIMTAFLRFQNVSIPKSARIDSAYLFIYAHEDESAESRINIYGENIDNSPAFTENEAFNNRSLTTSMVEWNITENWTMWEQYKSPNLKSIIQQLVNRTGWTSGNAITLFFRGEDQGASLLDNARDFESFENIADPNDGGDGLQHPERIPNLKVWFNGPTGTKEIEINFFDVVVYPNPSYEYINVVINNDKNADAVISLIGITGEVVYQEKTNSTLTTIDVNQLSGLYLLSVKLDNKIITRKLVIK